MRKNIFLLLYFSLSLFLNNALAQPDACSPCPGNEIASVGDHMYTTNLPALSYNWVICDGDATIVSGQGTNTITVNPGELCYTVKLLRVTRKGQCIHSCIEECGHCDPGNGPGGDDCHCHNVNNNCLHIAQEGTPQDCETIFAWISPTCVQDECVDYVIWSAQGPVTYPAPGQTVTGGLSMSWDLEPFGANNHFVVVYASIVLTNGEVCTTIIDNELLECDGGPGHGGGIGMVEEESNTVGATGLKAFPNPVRLGGSITIPFEDINGASSVRLMNIEGEVMEELSQDDNTFEIGSTWTPGVYLIELIKDDIPQITRIVIN